MIIKIVTDSSIRRQRKVHLYYW